MTEVAEEIDEKRMPFTEHIRELRTRMLWALAAMSIAFGFAWVYREALFGWLMEPYRAGVVAVHPDATQLLQFRSLMEPFVVYLKTSLLVAGIASAPFALYQAWMFVAPGLYARERRIALPFLFASLVCFFGGVAFCRYVVLEPSVTVLLKMGGVHTSAAIMMAEYYSFISMLLLAFGFFFELPVVIGFLALVGLVNTGMLIRFWRYAFVGAFVVGAILPSPDIFTQSALAIPLIALYTLSIGLTWLIERSRKPAPEADA